MAKLRVVLDANIYISAILFGGLPDEIIKLGQIGSIQILLSEHIKNEVLKVLKIKFKWTTSQINEVKHFLSDITEKVDSRSIMIDVVKDDPTDNRILETATTGKASLIISGDSHLLKLRKYKSIKIISPRDYLSSMK